MSAPTILRCQLLARGYAPLPVVGKTPVLKAWQTKTSSNATEIALWLKLFPDASNTGVLTRLAPAIDIDILFPEAAEAVEDLAGCLGASGRF
jgi:hypothetical protein